MENKKINLKKISDMTYEVLNSPFYVDGKGGQLGDRGTIAEANIVEVKENIVILDKNLEDGEYTYSINEKRQEDIRQQHTAQHIFSAEAYNNFGLNTVGFRMAEEYTTVDLDQKDISKEVIEKLEELVNKDIKADILVEEEIYTNEEAHKFENLRKAIKEKIKGDVRFIKIGDVDICACAGFHVSRTSEIEIFKIINHENIKGNYTRFYFLAGDRAKNDYNKKHDIIKKITNTFSCKDDEILEMLDKSLKEKASVTAELKSLGMRYAELMAKDFENTFIDYKDFKILIYNEDENLVGILPKFINLDKFLLLIGYNTSYTLMSNIYDCKEIIINIVKNFPNIKGGGGKNKGNIKLDFIPLTPLRDMVEVKGKYNEIMLKDFYEGSTLRNDYLHITLTDEDDVQDVITKLRVVYKNIMKLDYDNQRTRNSAEINLINDMESKSPLELFDIFYESRNGQHLNDIQKDFMRNIIEDIWRDK